MSEKKLEPCPFCGGKLEKTPDGLTHKCPQGKANTLTIYTRSIKDFLKVWNSRPIEDALRKRVQELEAENKKIKKIQYLMTYLYKDQYGQMGYCTSYATPKSCPPSKTDLDFLANDMKEHYKHITCIVIGFYELGKEERGEE